MLTSKPLVETTEVRQHLENWSAWRVPDRHYDSLLGWSVLDRFVCDDAYHKGRPLGFVGLL